MKAMFIGDPRHDGDGPKVLILHGVAFPKDVWVEPVPDNLAAKLAGNSHFAVSHSTDPADTDLEGVELPQLVEGEPAADVLSAAEVDEEAALASEEAEAPGLTPAQIEALDRDDDGHAGGSTASDEKTALMAELDEMGVEFDRRLGVAKLRALLEEQRFLRGE